MDSLEEATLPADTSLPEVVRRLDEITRSVDRLVHTMEQSYVRRDVYDARHDALRSSVNGQVRDARDLFSIRMNAIESALNGQMAGIRDDVSEIKKARDGELAFKRQILAGFALIVISTLITGAIALSNFVARGGFG